jgi:hypothetical protein
MVRDDTRGGTLNDMGHEERVPSSEEIERAWRRPQSTPKVPSDPPSVRFVYRWQRAIWRSMKVFMVVWYVGLGLMTAAAAVDVFGHMGWGYHAKDIGSDLLMMALGVPLWGFLSLIRTIVSAWTRAQYGPDSFE